MTEKEFKERILPISFIYAKESVIDYDEQIDEADLIREDYLNGAIKAYQLLTNKTIVL